MKRLILSIAGLAALACTGAQSVGGAASAGFSAADSSAIVALNARLQTAALAGNWDAWAAEYTADPVRYPPNAPIIVGMAALSESLKPFPRATTFEVKVLSVVGRGDLAVVTGGFKVAFPPGRDAAGKATPALTDEGKFMQVLMKHSDGSWKIARDMYSSDLPVPGTLPPTKK